MTFWAAIAMGGIATYLTRFVPLAVRPRGSAPPALRRYLDALPIAVIAALAGSGIAMPSGVVTHGPEITAATVAFGLAWWRRNLLVAMIAGVIVVAWLRSVGAAG